MALTERQKKQLERIIKLAQKIRDDAKRSPSLSEGTGRSRRSSAEVEKMRREVLAARAAGVSATALAKKYGVSTAYIYMIKG